MPASAPPPPFPPDQAMVLVAPFAPTKPEVPPAAPPVQPAL